MNDHDRDEFDAAPTPGERREPVYDDDPVAKFFSAHRSAVPTEPANDLDWARISRGARSRRPGRFLKGAAAAAAVAAIVGFGAWTVQNAQSNSPVEAAASRSVTASPATPGAGQSPSAGPTDRSGATPSRSGDAGGMSPLTPAGRSGPQAQAVVPSRFVTWSLSNAGNNTVYDLGAGSCSGSICPVLLRSVDNGVNWAAVHTFGQSAAAATVQPGSGRIHATDKLRDVRFVTPKIGYVFGGDLWVTRDSGVTFTRVAHPGRTVLDVEAYQGDLLVVTGDQCASDTCSGSVTLTRMDTAADAVPAAAASSADLTAPIVSAQLVVRDKVGYITLIAAADGATLPPLRLIDGSLHPVSAPDTCSGSPLQALTPASTMQHHLFAVCAPVPSGSRTSYTLARSTDDGATWTRVSTGAVQLPTGARADLAALDDNHLAAAAGLSGVAGSGSVVGSGSLVVSTDGGASFVAKDGPLGIPATGIDWLASPGGRQYYAITLSGSGYWWTNDAGRTWRLVNPVG